MEISDTPPARAVGRHIVVCGEGLAAKQVCAALAPYLCDSLTVTWITGVAGADTDIFYGNLTSPAAYDFNLSLGVSEPDLILDSDTTFSYGTHFTNWGARRLDWVQAFHQPLPVLEGATFQHYLTQQGQEALEPFLVSAVAARRGVFAHPPEDPRHPLSRAEYGYHFDAPAYGAFFERAALRSGVRKVSADIATMDTVDGNIKALHLSNGQSVTADLWIDATGPQATLLSRIAGERDSARRLNAYLTRRGTQTPGPAATVINGTPYGWQARTDLRASTLTLTITSPDSDGEVRAASGTDQVRSASVDIGWRDMAWVGNCVGIGHAACVAEPLTVAPMLLLQRDIARLLPLLPVSDDLSVERREYNRQAMADYVHADLFMRALFETQPVDGAPYWHSATRTPADERLVRKIEQFESRGLHVAYDLEPFGPEDWLILHYGMGRRPLRYDRIVDGADVARIRQHLETLRGNIDSAVRSMPPHGTYLNGLTKYLRQQRGEA